MALETNTAEVEAGQSRLVAKWNRSLGELELRDGTRVYIDGADDGAYRIQGYNLRGAWCDEVGIWKRWKTSWDESLGFALRKGQARRVATGTPKRDQPARALVMRLLADPNVVTRRLRTKDNAHNLSAAFLQTVVAPHQGTELGRQELDGEVLEEAEGALWRRAWIEGNRRSALAAPLRRTVVGLDPADGLEGGAEQAICVAQVDLNGELYVVRSDGYRETPVAWLRRSVRLAADMRAQMVVEKNHGGAYLTGLLERVMVELGIRAPYKEISASQGKRTRAEPVAGLYEQGKVHHVGTFPELEDQLCTWDGTGESPDRLDACVWALTGLMGYARPAASTEPIVHRYTDAPAPGVYRYRRRRGRRAPLLLDSPPTTDRRRSPQTAQCRSTLTGSPPSPCRERLQPARQSDGHLAELRRGSRLRHRLDPARAAATMGEGRPASRSGRGSFEGLEAPGLGKPRHPGN